MIAPTRPAIAPLANMTRTAGRPSRTPPYPAKRDVLPAHAELVTCDRPPVDEDDGARDRRDDDDAGVERSGHDRKARAGRDHEGLGRPVVRREGESRRCRR